jgi:hypothetical protein
MENFNQSLGRFFKVMVNGQAYLNLMYLGATFPLGIFYFIFLVSGLSLGISLSIIWVGIPILVIMGGGWWALAFFERFMAVHLLKEEIPTLARPVNRDADIWAGFKEYLANPVTWKSLLYLFVKFPLGLITFVIIMVMIPLTVAFLSTPFTYETVQFFQSGISFGPWFPVWQIDSIGDALIGALVGLMLWPVTLHVTNGLAWVHAKFARVMLSRDPMERLNLTAEI